MKRWYEVLFENYGEKYDAESFTRGTSGECDFIEKETGFDTATRILDIGCGTGRHSVELALRGYRVTGFDLSEAQLRRARAKAAALGLTIDFRRHDARLPLFSNEFDLAIMLCEGAFPLMETDEMNYAILRNAAAALKPGGKFIFTTLNGLFPLFHSVKDFLAAEAEPGGATYGESSFDLMTFRDRSTVRIEDDSGKELELASDERYYVPCEIAWLLKSLGFTDIAIHGAKLGAFSRVDALSTEDYEMLVLAVKKPAPA